MRSAKRLSSILGIAVIAFFLQGTTYVVMEGDKEVGRYVEADGSNEQKMIRQEPRPAKVKLPPPEGDMQAPETILREEGYFGDDVALAHQTIWDIWIRIVAFWIIAIIIFFWIKKKTRES